MAANIQTTNQDILDAITKGHQELREIHQKVGDVQQKVEDIQQQVNQIEETQQQLQDYFKEIHQKVGDVQRQVNQIEESQQQLQDDFKEIQQQVGRIEESQQQFEEFQQQLQDGQEGIRNDFAERFGILELRNTASNTNSIARTQNSMLTLVNGAITPLVNPTTNQRIASFPSTGIALRALSTRSANAVLRGLSLPVEGDLTDKRNKICIAIGLRDASL